MQVMNANVQIHSKEQRFWFIKPFCGTFHANNSSNKYLRQKLLHFQAYSPHHYPASTFLAAASSCFFDSDFLVNEDEVFIAVVFYALFGVWLTVLRHQVFLAENNGLEITVTFPRKFVNLHSGHGHPL